VLNPALAEAMIGGWVWRIVMYGLIWQSVTWRPGKVRFLIAMKNRSISNPPRSPDARLFGGRDVAGFAVSVGLRPPWVANPAMLLILIDALFSP
jgi:hypothetical protein